ncbi:MAG: tetratricopeptide repeat protein [Bacteroidetes bacterium]|nr:tetratricopeptide repeat protein [Bacteroidota bacterium]MBS1939274.1 tetratricopeptide repeat protein [Bacteroidota bacterium]
MPALVSAQPTPALNDSLEKLLAHTGQDTSRVRLYASWMAANMFTDPKATVELGLKALHLADSLRWQPGQLKVRRTIARAYWKSGDFTQALKYDMEVLRTLEAGRDPRALADQLRRVGQDHLDGGNTAEARRYLGRSLEYFRQHGDRYEVANVLGLFAYLHEIGGDHVASAKTTHEALTIYEALGNDQGVAMCTGNLARIYAALGRTDEALVFYQRALRNDHARTAADSVNLATTLSELGDLYLGLGRMDEAQAQFTRALAIGSAIHDNAQMAMANRGFGTIALMRKDYAKGLRFLRAAVVQFRESGFMRIDQARTIADMGYCLAHLGQLDSAQLNFDRVRTIAVEMHSPVALAEHYRAMEFLDSLRGDWEGAYRNGIRFHVLQDSIAGSASSEKVVRAQLHYEEEKRDLVERAAQEKRDIRQRTIRNSIAAVLAGALIFLVVVYRQRGRIKKEHARSEELLLNILPEEVAEELKAKGAAEATYIEQVTVLFTDFKGFTAMSEVVTPRQLVHDLHECFSAFDRICEKHNIEKIKTIGDAYMAAGGLPTPNATHAVDAINAVLEMRDFIAEGKARKVAAGLAYFEIRIGIHTGPVVAGIVGVKKFQYDIWGDTVNTASRMESSGEVGQVNISGATYALVKDAVVSSQLSVVSVGAGSRTTDNQQLTTKKAFTFTPRGKVQAKGKGEMEMYFVHRNPGGN